MFLIIICQRVSTLFGCFHFITKYHYTVCKSTNNTRHEHCQGHISTTLSKLYETVVKTGQYTQLSSEYAML